MKVKLVEIARLAGVGHATVDRVLNQRGGVKPDTARRVIEVARALGLDRKLPTLYRQGLRFEVILGRKSIPICARLNDAFMRLGRLFDDVVAVERTFVDDTRPDLFAEAILQSRSNALIVYGQEHELIVDAIAEVTSRSKPVVTIVSDVPSAPRFTYVGTDHHKAGRSAAFFLSRIAREGHILLLCSNLQYRAQAERISGCREGLEDYSNLESTTILLELGDGDRLVSRLMSELPTTISVTGIYNAGADYLALEAILADHHVAANPVVIGHDLAPETERMLRDGSMTLVVDQNPDLQARKAMSILARRFGIDEGAEEDSTVPFTIHVRDNI